MGLRIKTTGAIITNPMVARGDTTSVQKAYYYDAKQTANFTQISLNAMIIFI